MFLLLAGSILLFCAAPVFSQQCALCYTQAASSGKKMIEALRSGILILVVPPTLASLGMIYVLYRKNNQARRTEGWESHQEW